jgi:hypothetical protein
VLKDSSDPQRHGSSEARPQGIGQTVEDSRSIPASTTTKPPNVLPSGSDAKTTSPLLDAIRGRDMLLDDHNGMYAGESSDVRLGNNSLAAGGGAHVGSNTSGASLPTAEQQPISVRSSPDDGTSPPVASSSMGKNVSQGTIYIKRLSNKANYRTQVHQLEKHRVQR